MRTTAALILVVALLGCDPESSRRSPVPPPQRSESAGSGPDETSARVPAEQYRKLDEARTKEILGAALVGEVPGPPPGRDAGGGRGLEYESLYHVSLQGPVGPYERAVVAFPDDGRDSPESVSVVVAHSPGSRGGWRAHRLGPLAGPWRPTEIESVFFTDARDDDDIDLFVVGRFVTGLGGRTTRHFAATIPYVWREGRFRYPNHLEDRLTDAGSAERALEILRRDGLLPDD